MFFVLLSGSGVSGSQPDQTEGDGPLQSVRIDFAAVRRFR
jgi:hypothetical protein